MFMVMREPQEKRVTHTDHVVNTSEINRRAQDCLIKKHKTKKNPQKSEDNDLMLTTFELAIHKLTACKSQ